MDSIIDKSILLKSKIYPQIILITSLIVQQIKLNSEVSE